MAELRYKGWGETRYSYGSTPTTYHFTGQREDATIGLYFYRARYYDPALGRFVQPDTIVPAPGNPQSLNRYAYVLNNPLRYTDPSGHGPTAGCEYEGCTLPAGLPPQSTWLLPNGAYALVDPQLVAAYDYNPLTEAVLPGAVMLVGVAAAPTIAAEAVVPAAQTALSWLLEALGLACADANCTNEMQGVIERAFGGNWSLFEQFVQTLRPALPSGTRIAMRGSALTGHSWRTGRPFDALGPGSSDLDIVLVGKQVMSQWSPSAFYIRGINTIPLSDKTSTVAPSLNPVRVALQQMVDRPVNFQAMPQWFLELRRLILGQPYRFLSD